MFNNSFLEHKISISRQSHCWIKQVWWSPQKSRAKLTLSKPKRSTPLLSFQMHKRSRDLREDEEKVKVSVIKQHWPLVLEKWDFLHVLTVWTLKDMKFSTTFFWSRINKSGLVKVFKYVPDQRKRKSYMQRLSYCISKLNSHAHYNKRQIWKGPQHRFQGSVASCPSIYQIYIYSSMSCKLNLGSTTEDWEVALLYLLE